MLASVANRQIGALRHKVRIVGRVREQAGVVAPELQALDCIRQRVSESIGAAPRALVRDNRVVPLAVERNCGKDAVEPLRLILLHKVRTESPALFATVEHIGARLASLNHLDHKPHARRIVSPQAIRLRLLVQRNDVILLRGRLHPVLVVYRVRVTRPQDCIAHALDLEPAIAEAVLLSTKGVDILLDELFLGLRCVRATIGKHRHQRLDVEAEVGVHLLSRVSSQLTSPVRVGGAFHTSCSIVLRF